MPPIGSHQRTSRLCLFVFVLFLVLAAPLFVNAFLPVVHKSSSSPSQGFSFLSKPKPDTKLYSGRGIATNYTWYEEAFELEVSVKVPPSTKASQIEFQATSHSLALSLKDGTCLLDPNRPLRGKILTDGTFWEIVDADDGDHRIITVTIEKVIKNQRDAFDIIEYDWKGLYADEGEEEVSYRHYDEAEPLDVREYAASLGVDVDNINMSMVDKNMFSSGLNLTHSTMNQMVDAGLMKEVTEQGDGSQWLTDKDGFRVPLSENQTFTTQATSAASSMPPKSPPQVPFLDTSSPWHNVSSKEDATTSLVTDQDQAAAAQKMMQDRQRQAKKEALVKQRQMQAKDPIDTLTVARLKEILKSKGLKVSGNKAELQDRLRNHVQTLMEGEKQQDKEEQPTDV